MPETHFEILELPPNDLVVSTIDGNPLLANTLYPIAQENLVQFDKHPDYASVSLLVGFTWKGHNTVDNIESGIRSARLKFIGNDLPLSLDKTVEINNSEELLLIDVVYLNDSVDIVKIETIEGYNGFKKSGQDFYPGMLIKPQDLANSFYNALDSGGGFPYSKITYTVGKNNVFQPTIYNFNIDIDVLSELSEGLPREEFSFIDEFDNMGTPEDHTVQTEQIKAIVSNGIPFGIANIELVINSDFLSLNSWNNIIVETNEGPITKYANETFNVDLPLNEFGYGELNITNYIVENTADPKDGEITVNLLTINSELGTVEPLSNQIVLTSNY